MCTIYTRYASYVILTDAGLIGGSAVPRPGEVSLAHYEYRALDRQAQT